MGGQADAEAFSHELASLKREGCNVLVVSDAAERDAICERLLGAPELDRRHVFLTTSTDAGSVLQRHEPRRTDPSSFGVVDATGGTQTRSAAAVSTVASEPTLAGDAWYDRVDDLTDFEALLDAARDALDRVAANADAPAEVRFCLDGLDPFLDAASRDEADQEALFRFLHALTGSVRDVDGMGHAHVSAGVDQSLVATFEPLFDATIFVDRGDDGTVRQRWRLHESGRETDWFEL